MSGTATLQEPVMEPTNEPDARSDLADVRPIPRITIQCFCETEDVRQTLETAATDRRMARTQG